MSFLIFNKIFTSDVSSIYTKLNVSSRKEAMDF